MRIAAASPKLWMDAYLAAFAMTANDALSDKAFREFKGLVVRVLAESSARVVQHHAGWRCQTAR